MVSITLNNKESFVVEYLKEHQFTDVLDAEFVLAFANRFNCKGRRMSIGAPRVPLAGKTLSAMFKKGLLTRSVSGLDSYAGGYGFPKWVYTYAINKTLDSTNE